MNSSWGRTLFWLCLVAAAAYGIHLLAGILLPFVAGAGIAFLLDPLADRLETLPIGRWRLGRTLASLIVLVAFFLFIGLFILLVAPLLEEQIAALIEQIPHYVDLGRQKSVQLIRLLNRKLSPDDANRVRAVIGEKIGDVLGGAMALLTSVLTGGVAIASVLSLVVITPIVAFFLLRDWDRIIDTIDSWLPRAQLHTLREQARQIQETLSGFIRGQAAVCAVMGIFYGTALTILGLNFGLILGLFVGFLIFIPFLGGLTGAVICVVLAFTQFGDWHQPLFVAILFVLGQSIEGNVLTPKLVGDRVHLHPVWVIFALLAAGTVFGFVGVLLAVPIAAVIGVLVRFAIRSYLQSALYDPLNIRVPDDPYDLPS